MGNASSGQRNFTPNAAFVKTSCSGVDGACYANAGSSGETVKVPASYGYVCGPAGGTPACASIVGGEFVNTDVSTCDWATPSGAASGLYGGFTCRRAKNTAATKACCLNQPTNGKSCASNVNVNNGPVCNVHWQTACAGSEILGADCQKWAALQPAAAAGVMNAYCNTPSGLKNAACRQSCIASGKCDSGASAYCAAATRNPDGTLVDPDAAAFCGCLTSKMTRPECFDNACTKNGYKTATMRNGTDCGTLIQCTASWNINGTSNISEQNSIIQNCADGKSPPPPVTTPPTTTTPPVTPTPQPPVSPPVTETPTSGDETSLDDKWAQIQTSLTGGGDGSGDDSTSYLPIIIIIVLGLIILLAVGGYFAMRSPTPMPQMRAPRFMAAPDG